MRRGIAESLAADIEAKELLECIERVRRFRELAAATHGNGRETFLQEAENAENELNRWNELLSIVRSWSNPEKSLEQRQKTGT